jgi:hypothetical protein
MQDPRRRRSLPLSIAIAVAVLLAGCSDSVPTATFGGPPTLTGAPAAQATAAAPTDPPLTAEPLPTGSPNIPGTPACPIDELKASRGITRIDGDERVTEVILVAAGTCSIDAFPALLLQDADSNVVVAAGPAGQGGIDLVGGVAYSSEVRISNWCAEEPAYPVSIGISHGLGTLLVTGDSFPDEGDLPPCANDDADPVLSATAWQPAS